MLKKPYVPPHLDRFPARAQLLCSGPNDTRPDQQGDNESAGGGAATPDCAGFWIPSTATLESLGKKEKWLQDRICKQPSLLGLGNVSFVRAERTQPSGGRFDILLRSGDGNQRYEVEVQLGATNPSHIIRTIEYWDIERRRYPQFSHCGVLVAEEITGRFFNVVSLLNSSGQMPLMAIKLTAIKSPCERDGVGLLFTKILAGTTAPDESEDEARPATEQDWNDKVGGAQMEFAEKIFSEVAGDEWEMNLTIHAISMKNKKSEKTNATFSMIPTQAHVWLRFRMEQIERWDKELQSIDGYEDYQLPYGRYRLRTTPSNFDGQKNALIRLFQEAVGKRSDE